MALMNCPECKSQVSDKAANCPHCGYPINTNTHVQSLRTENIQGEHIAKTSPTTSRHLPFTIIIIVGAIFLSVVIYAVFFRPCKHEWQDATCNVPTTCTICGEISGEKLTHSWVDATCDTPMTCTFCNITNCDELGHKWIDATYETPKTCSICKNTEGDCKKRPQVNSSTGAIDAIQECLNFIPDCKISISEEKDSNGSTTYAIRHRGDLVGVIGLDVDDFDVLALIDPKKDYAKLDLEQIAIAMLLSSDSDMTYEDAKMYFQETENGGLQWMNNWSSFISRGMAEGMYAFGIGY